MTKRNNHSGAVNAAALTLLGLISLSIFAATLAVLQNNFDIRQRAQGLYPTPTPVRYACVDNRCEINANGEYRTVSECSESCKANPSPAYKEIGDTCADYQECKSGYCDSNTKTCQIRPLASSFGTCPADCRNGCYASDGNGDGLLDCLAYCKSECDQFGGCRYESSTGGACKFPEGTCYSDGASCDPNNQDLKCCQGFYCQVSSSGAKCVPDISQTQCPQDCTSGCVPGTTLCKQNYCDSQKCPYGCTFESASGGQCNGCSLTDSLGNTQLIKVGEQTQWAGYCVTCNQNGQTTQTIGLCQTSDSAICEPGSRFCVDNANNTGRSYWKICNKDGTGYESNWCDEESVCQNKTCISTSLISPTTNKYPACPSSILNQCVSSINYTSGVTYEKCEVIVDQVISEIKYCPTNLCSQINSKNECDQLLHCSYQNNQCVRIGTELGEGKINVSVFAGNGYEDLAVNDLKQVWDILPKHITQNIDTVGLVTFDVPIFGSACGRTFNDNKIYVNLACTCNPDSATDPNYININQQISCQNETKYDSNLFYIAVNEIYHNTEKMTVESTQCSGNTSCQSIDAWANAAEKDGITFNQDGTVNGDYTYIYNNNNQPVPDYELYAETLTMCVTNPEYVKNNFPNIYEICKDLNQTEYAIEQQSDGSAKIVEVKN